MYLEHTDSNRSGWKYVYKGSELIQAARRIRDEYQRRETEARDRMSRLMKDPRVSPSSRDVDECKREIERVAKIFEECQVFAHEFQRNPEREYNLSQGDVVFFGLIQKDR